jgi:hypothetical protein
MILGAMPAEAAPGWWAGALLVPGLQCLPLVCALVGALRLTRSRLAGLRWFKRGLLLSLLVAQPLAFFEAEFGALGGLAEDLILWIGVSYLLQQETLRHFQQPAMPLEEAG